MLNLDNENFNKEIIESKIPAVVDFWAEWCPPCQMIGPILEELATVYQEKIKFAKVNVDEQPDLAQKFSIMSIPTLLFFKDGQVVDKVIGAVPKSFLLEKLKNFIE